MISCRFGVFFEQKPMMLRWYLFVSRNERASLWNALGSVTGLSTDAITILSLFILIYTKKNKAKQWN